MTHKVHPKSFRIRSMSDWGSRGFYGKNMPGFLEEDLQIRDFLEKRLKDAGLAKVDIERFPGRIIVMVEALRPGFIIGRGGGGIEILRKSIEKIISRGRRKRFLSSAKSPIDKGIIKIDVLELRNPWIHPGLVGQWVADQLEKRMPFRRTMKQSLEKVVANSEGKGARIEISGRLDGNEIARREWLQAGQMPRQTLRDDLDYAPQEANCSYGVIGIKVWIYKGEKLD